MPYCSFLAADLELGSLQPLKNLIQGLGDLSNLHENNPTRGLHIARFTLANNPLEASACIKTLCHTIETLSPSQRKMWDTCINRRLNLEFRGNHTPESFTPFDTVFNTALIQRFANLNASLSITLYPVSPTPNTPHADCILTNFRCIDLDISTHDTPTTLIEPLKEASDNILNTIDSFKSKQNHVTIYELHSSTHHSLESSLQTFCQAIESLEGSHRQEWQNALSRRFDIAFDTGDAPHTHLSILHAKTLDRISRLNAEIKLTFYPL
ncbi:MAG: hypothetical protein V3V20_09965, partial [Algisphaera sp.]